jgi:hypothetical protein
VYDLLTDWITLQNCPYPQAFTCPRASSGENLVCRYLGVFCSCGHKTTRSLSSLLFSFGQTFTSHTWEGGVSTKIHSKEIVCAMLINEAFGGMWLSHTACQKWFDDLQALIAEEPTLYEAVWQQAIAMLQVCYTEDWAEKAARKQDLQTGSWKQPYKTDGPVTLESPTLNSLIP